MPSPILQARAQLGVATRLGDRPAAEDARRELAVAKIEKFIARAVAEAPPLTPEQRDRVARALRDGGTA